MKKRLTRMLIAALTLLTIGVPVALAQSGSAGPSADDLANPADGDWPTVGRDLGMQRFSPLDQITTDNVNQLQIAWSRDLGFDGGVQFSPVEYEGVLYAVNPNTVMALDATTGDVNWTYTATLDKRTAGLAATTMRGGVVLFNGNVYASLGDGRVVALDQTDGTEVWSTQVAKIDLAEGLTSEPIFADGKIVVGPSGGDQGGVPGRIVALDPADGHVLWTFHVVPQPGTDGFDTWQPPTAAQWGGGSAWAPGSYDSESNTIFWGTGNPTPWFSPGVRSGDNLYTTSHVALDADTGALKWYHQVVPADEWDYDQHTTPTVINYTAADGTTTRAVVLPTTTGFVNVVDVATGDYLASYNIFEKQTGQKGAVHKGYTDDWKPIINEDQRMENPGDTAEWCPSRWTSFETPAYSPQTGLYYRPNSLLCMDLTGQPLPDDWQPGQSAIGDSFVAQPDKFDRLGGISAIDLKTGDIVWEFTYPYDEKSGVVATAGGLVFVASPDRVFRAFDAKTGDVLWQQTLTAAMFSSPISYEVDGTQYIAVPVGGALSATAAAMKDAPPEVSGSGSMFVFALPQAPTQAAN